MSAHRELLDASGQGPGCKPHVARAAVERLEARQKGFGSLCWE